MVITMIMTVLARVVIVVMKIMMNLLTTKLIQCGVPYVVCSRLAIVKNDQSDFRVLKNRIDEL